MLNGAQKNLSANSENAEPLTYNFVFTALSGFQLLSIQRFLGARSRADPSRDDSLFLFSLSDSPLIGVRFLGPTKSELALRRRRDWPGEA